MLWAGGWGSRKRGWVGGTEIGDEKVGENEVVVWALERVEAWAMANG